MRLAHHQPEGKSWVRVVSIFGLSFVIAQTGAELMTNDNWEMSNGKCLRRRLPKGKKPLDDNAGAARLSLRQVPVAAAFAPATTIASAIVR